MVRLLESVKRLLTKIRVSDEEFIKLYPDAFHQSIFSKLVRSKCVTTGHHIYYKGYSIDFCIFDRVTYYVRINGSEYNDSYNLSDIKRVDDVCELLDELIDTYKHGPSYAMLRKVLINAGVKKKDLIDKNGTMIAIKGRDGREINFDVADKLTYERVNAITEFLRAIY